MDDKFILVGQKILNSKETIIDSLSKIESISLRIKHKNFTEVRNINYDKFTIEKINNSIRISFYILDDWSYLLEGEEYSFSIVSK
jgi:hypothetical protein